MGNRLALITGASRGIGREIAIKFAKSGIDLVLNFKSDLEGAKETEEICRRYGVDVLIQEGDVSNSAVVKEIFKNIVERFNRIDILVNNAGITRDKLTVRMKDEDFEEVIDVNLKASFYTMREASKLMIKKRQGVIVNISSIVGLRGNPGQINYSASKAGLIGMTKSLAREVGARNIRVNAVAPGFIETDMTQELKKDLKESIIRDIPLGSLGESQDVANLVKFLVSDEAKYITGQVISVDGGMSI